MVDSKMNKPLRPLFVNSGLGYGGAETQLVQSVRELARRGHDPHVYLLTRLAPRSRELAEFDVPIILDEKKRKIDFGTIQRLRKYIRHHKIDLVHSFLFDANIYARLACIGLRVPVLNAERSCDYCFTTSQWFAHSVTCWRVDGVVANSHAGRAFAQDLYRLPRDRTHVTWNGIDLTELDRRCRESRRSYKFELFGSSDVKMAVFVGSVNESKDHELALAVSEALIREDASWRVVFVGASFDASLFDYEVSAVAESAQLAVRLESRRKSMRDGAKIVFLGRREDAIEIISQANVLFSTSLREGFPNVVLEAMAAGVPVVSTEYSDIRLILENPDWIIGSRDPAEMAVAIRKVNEDRTVIGAALRRWVEINATIQKSVDALLGVYRYYTSA